MKRGLKQPQLSTEAPAIPALQNPFVVPCAWVGADGPCLLPGTIGLGRYDGDKAYCSWHGEFLIHGQDTRFVSDREEFERWVAKRRRAYCGVFSHHDASALWYALQGVAQLGQPQACGRADCRWRGSDELPF